MSMKDFSANCNLSLNTIYNIENGKVNKPHKDTFQTIAEVYGSSLEWILNGRGDMLLSGVKLNIQKSAVIKNPETTLSANEQEMFNELKIKNKGLEMEIERLWRMIEYFVNPGNSNHEDKNINFNERKIG